MNVTTCLSLFVCRSGIISLSWSGHLSGGIHIDICTHHAATSGWWTVQGYRAALQWSCEKSWLFVTPSTSIAHDMTGLPDDVIKWKHFPRYWPFVREFIGHRWIPRTQKPVTRSFDIFFDLRLNKRFIKQSWGWWFGTPSRPLWRHSNVGSTCW